MSVHVTDRLSAYLDGDLGARDLEHVQAHLETCASCQREYGELRTLKSMLRSLPEPVPSEGFAERLHWRLQREAGRPARLALFWSFTARPLRLALACATLLLVLALPLGWMTGRFAGREAALDADAYLRSYLLLSADRPFSDEVATTLAAAEVIFPEPQPR